MRRWYLAVGLGLAGALVSSLIVWWLASSDTSFSQNWLVLGVLFPVGGLYLAWSDFGKEQEVMDQQSRTRVAHAGFVVLGGLFGTLAHYVAFVIASGIWNADMIDPSHSGFLYQLSHPSVLPSLSDTRSGGSGSEMSAVSMSVIGFFTGLVMTYLLTRKPRRKKGSES